MLLTIVLEMEVDFGGADRKCAHATIVCGVLASVSAALSTNAYHLLSVWKCWHRSIVDFKFRGLFI
jgi:hypothetical protein